MPPRPLGKILNSHGIITDEQIMQAMAYQQKCIEEDIPFLGFFDSIYSPEHPFQLPRPE